jgi:acetyl-CoA acetyltransferase
VLGEATPLSGVDDDDIMPPSSLAAQTALEASGVAISDLDLVECQDTDAAREILAYEELGLCGRGDGARLVADRTTLPTGRLPVNVSGGLLSKGEPLGASALGQVFELADHLRDRAGARQVEGARVGLAHTVGRGANAAVVVVTR